MGYLYLFTMQFDVTEELTVADNKTRMRVIAASPSDEVSGAEGDFRHFRSSQQQADGINRLAKYDFLLVFYSDVAETVVELEAVEVSRL